MTTHHTTKRHHYTACDIRRLVAEYAGYAVAITASLALVGFAPSLALVVANHILSALPFVSVTL